jgi:uncharacterized protein YutE (UPF0331/DUF86 family)
MISSSHPAFAKLGPKLERAHRELANLDDFLRLYAALTELKGFRHCVRHRYGFDLNAAKTDESLARMRRSFPHFVEAVRRLEQVMTAEADA